MAMGGINQVWWIFSVKKVLILNKRKGFNPRLTIL